MQTSIRSRSSVEDDSSRVRGDFLRAVLEVRGEYVTDDPADISDGANTVDILVVSSKF